MKTIAQIKSEIKDHLEKANFITGSRENKSAGKQLIKLYRCLYYIELEPKEEYLKESIKDLRAKKEFIDKRYREWFNNTPGATEVNDPRAKYNSLMGTRAINGQIQTIEYLLS